MAQDAGRGRGQVRAAAELGEDKLRVIVGGGGVAAAAGYPRQAIDVIESLEGMLRIEVGRTVFVAHGG